MFYYFIAGSTFSVTVHIVDRGDDDPIFNNRPIPLWTTCPVWIRPSTVIYSVKSVDQVTYGSRVYYRLEAGKFVSLLTVTSDLYVLFSYSFLPLAGKVIAGLTESTNGSLLLGDDLKSHLPIHCLYTALNGSYTMQGAIQVLCFFYTGISLGPSAG